MIKVWELKCCLLNDVANKLIAVVGVEREYHYISHVDTSMADNHNIVEFNAAHEANGDKSLPNGSNVLSAIDNIDNDAELTVWVDGDRHKVLSLSMLNGDCLLSC